MSVPTATANPLVCAFSYHRVNSLLRFLSRLTRQPPLVTPTGTPNMQNADAPVSKNAIKKQMKRERLEHLRETRKATRKQRKKEQKEKRKSIEQMHPTSRPTKKEDKERLRKAMESGLRVAVDLSWTHLMTEKEIGSLCRQLTIIYTENKRSTHPVHLYFTSLGGAFREAFEKFSPTYHNWIMDVTETPYFEIFSEEKASIVYLSADSPVDIRIHTPTGEDGQSTPFNSDTILVIGGHSLCGLIDRNRHKNVCFSEAEKRGIAHAQLPLHLMENRNKGLRVLTTNQCVEMLLRYNETLDWTSAVTATFPKRKMIPKATVATSDIKSTDPTPDERC